MSNVNITWLGHACFRLSYKGRSVVLDPYGDGTVPGLEPLRVKADDVLCSHGHSDHNAKQLVERNPLVSTAPEYRVDSYVAPHDHHMGEKRGMTWVRVFRFGEMKVAHLGDLGCVPEEGLLKILEHCDAMLIPIGGYYTIDAKEALEIVEKTKPRVVVPMHYRSETFGFDVIDTLDTFAAAFENKMELATPHFQLTRDSPAGLVIPALGEEKSPAPLRAARKVNPNDSINPLQKRLQK